MTPEPAAHSQPQADPREVSRRKWLIRIGAGLNAIAATLLGIPIVGYILAGFEKPKQMLKWIDLGPLEQFPAGETRLATFRNPFARPWDGDTANTPCWVRHIEGDKFQVFAINCTHLGCPVRWFPGSHLFMCPCHGGVFYEDGKRASGPPERELYEYGFRVTNGHLEIFGGQLPTLADPLTKTSMNRGKCPGAVEPPAAASDKLIQIGGDEKRGGRAC
jgi:nitrite reductase/ring-hydroxylating ferredoxin subunit